MDNLYIEKILRKMAVLCEINGDNVFKVRAYQKAADVISKYPKNIEKLSYDEIISISGIGKNIALHIMEIIKTGSFKEFNDYLSKYPAGVIEITDIPSLGAKRAKILYEKLKVDSKDKLFEYAKKGMIKELDGFGEKLEKSIIDYFTNPINIDKRFLYHNAKSVAIEIVNYLKSFGYKKVEYAGSLRRCKDTIGDIDIICVGDSSIIDKFIKYPQIERVINCGDVKASVVLKNQIQCDLRVFEEDCYGSALCYFTGSKQHNIKLREIANKMGYALNEYGLFDRNKRKLAGKTEKEIYEKLLMAYIPPELREDMGEIELAQQNKVPKLIELKDINGDVHCHTNYTDGKNSIKEIVNFLSKKYKWFFLGDHSVPLNFVHGLSFNEYLKTKEELLKLKNSYKKINFGRSMEIEILKDGSFAYSNDEMKDVDLVIGAIHTSIKMKRDEMTKRVIKAITNPYCDIIAHISQRLLFERGEIDMDYDLIFDIAQKTNLIFEVNGQPQRMDLTDINIRKVKSMGLKVVLTSDAHSLEQFDYIEYALNNARRAGLTKNDVLNCLEYKEFNDYISENRRRKGG